MDSFDRASAVERRSTKVFKALSDTTRRQILQLLEEKSRSVGEIVDLFDLTQPTISRHLAILREADLIIDRRRGQQVFYSLNGPVLSQAMVLFYGHFHGCRDALKYPP